MTFHTRFQPWWPPLRPGLRDIAAQARDLAASPVSMNPELWPRGAVIDRYHMVHDPHGQRCARRGRPLALGDLRDLGACPFCVERDQDGDLHALRRFADLLERATYHLCAATCASRLRLTVPREDAEVHLAYVRGGMLTSPDPLWERRDSPYRPWADTTAARATACADRLAGRIRGSHPEGALLVLVAVDHRIAGAQAHVLARALHVHPIGTRRTQVLSVYPGRAAPAWLATAHTNREVTIVATGAATDNADLWSVLDQLAEVADTDPVGAVVTAQQILA